MATRYLSWVGTIDADGTVHLRGLEAQLEGVDGLRDADAAVAEGAGVQYVGHLARGTESGKGRHKGKTWTVILVPVEAVGGAHAWVPVTVADGKRKAHPDYASDEEAEAEANAAALADDIRERRVDLEIRGRRASSRVALEALVGEGLELARDVSDAHGDAGTVRGRLKDLECEHHETDALLIVVLAEHVLAQLDSE